MGLNQDIPLAGPAQEYNCIPIETQCLIMSVEMSIDIGLGQMEPRSLEISPKRNQLLRGNILSRGN